MVTRWRAETSQMRTFAAPRRYGANLVTRSSGMLLPLTSVRGFFRACAFTWMHKGWSRVGWKGGGASLPPPCSLPHCTAAVSAGMAPLTICSLIANIRVHFLRHWTGTERWRAVLWAFLSLSLSHVAFLALPLLSLVLV